jgi:hypothetical protein
MNFRSLLASLVAISTMAWEQVARSRTLAEEGLIMSETISYSITSLVSVGAVIWLSSGLRLLLLCSGTHTSLDPEHSQAIFAPQC